MRLGCSRVAIVVRLKMTLKSAWTVGTERMPGWIVARGSSSAKGCLRQMQAQLSSLFFRPTTPPLAFGAVTAAPRIVAETRVPHPLYQLAPGTRRAAGYLLVIAR